MKKLLISGVLVALLGLALASAPVQADETGTLSLTGCPGPGCPNATYSFDIGATSAELTINITGPVSASMPGNDFITGVDLGFTPSGNISGLTLASNPGGGPWTTDTASLGNNGCGTNSGAFVCSSASPGLSITDGGTYTWVWD